MNNQQNKEGRPVIRRVTGKGFVNIEDNQTVYGSLTKAQPTSANRIKGVFGRKVKTIEWVNTDTDEIFYIDVLPLRPAELRILGENVFTDPVLSVLEDPNVSADDTTKVIKEHFGFDRDSQVIEKYNEMRLAVVKAVLVDEELKNDDEWLENEASEEFLDLVSHVGKGGVTETSTVDTFPSVDPSTDEQDGSDGPSGNEQDVRAESV